jgi:amidase
MQTTSGSLALEGNIAPRDAFLVEKLREAGAIILGKTNLSEWANFRSTHSSSGWSGRGGQTRNPYAVDRSPSGSSSGSAAAVSANLCTVAVGSETDGSIVSPSSVNGVVGIKPTLGLVSRSGIIPISHSQDTAGPIARSVADAAALLTVLAGADPNDPITAEGKGKTSDYTAALVPGKLKGARLGIVRAKGFGLLTKTDAVLSGAVEALKREGAILVDPVEIESLGKFDDSELLVLLYEFKDDLNRYLASRPDLPVHSLADLISFNEKNASQEMPYFGQELFTQAQEKGPLTTKEYVDALAKNHKLARTEGIDAAMAKHKLDALVMITNGPSWLIDLVNGDYFTGGSSSLAAVAGYPSITVPAGFIEGLPLGVSFTGRAWSEAQLIGLAYSFEQAMKARRVPQFRPTAI